VGGGGTLDEIAAEVPRPEGTPSRRGLTAEDPERTSRRRPGCIEQLALPSGPGIRVDTGVAAGDVIPPQYDSMIAKVIAWAGTGASAGPAYRALKQTGRGDDGGTRTRPSCSTC